MVVTRQVRPYVESMSHSDPTLAEVASRVWSAGCRFGTQDLLTRHEGTNALLVACFRIVAAEHTAMVEQGEG